MFEFSISFTSSTLLMDQRIFLPPIIFCIGPHLHARTFSQTVIERFSSLDQAPARILTDNCVRGLMAVAHSRNTFHARSLRTEFQFMFFRKGKQNLIKINCEPLRVRAEVCKNIPWLLYIYTQLHLTLKGVGKSSANGSVYWMVSSV